MSLDQSNKTEHGVQHVAAGTPFHLPALSDTDLAGEPAIRFAVALDAVNDLHAKTQQVQADPHLTGQGKDAQLRPHRERTLDQVAATLEALDSYSGSLDKREAELLRVPELHREAAAEAIIDRELRDYWRSLDMDGRHKLLDAMNSGPEHQRLEIALLRSPYAQLDHEIRVVRESWNRGRRIENPTEAFAIEAGRSQVEWGRRAMSHLSSITLRTTAMGEGALKALVSAGREKAAKAFGYDQGQIEDMKRQIQIEKQRSAA
ncbi:hypothetical protein SAMN02800694_2768 [Luteibacter sp. UNCMF331Sha3.1]|uniref:hypothetical protein n=1 Tax=Luteibacter sp. UNCMF331Sha3.1 TaxID=1502760 RepID=UPI0008CC0ED1|nr:hypothetical protein [Luteibacter sp. UNCMF331Sha3.1]SEN09934.1 hypothetical protein SAMN02800694_2768 [Luteibacter sp. UNCMF331Sha3.1]